MKPTKYLALATIILSAVLHGCGGGDGGPMAPVPTSAPTSSLTAPTSAPIPGATVASTASATATPRATPRVTPRPTTMPIGTATVALVTYTDPWMRATPRWRDIANNLYASTFQAGPSAFSYGRANVTLSYDRAPGTPYFSGRISARGLKPNFAYQIKLAGKPVSGSRGFGASGSFIEASTREPGASPILRERRGANGQVLAVGGDDWTNQALGYAGRWWDDTSPPSTNLDDDYFRDTYPSHTLYGYIFAGMFVTDARGEAQVSIAASHSYHITWQNEQSGPKEADAGSYAVRTLSPDFYGYGRPLNGGTYRLWYEYEPGRPRTVRLPAGTYHCRLLLTEEAFHTEGGEGGGIWQTVLASEGPSDSNPANDVVFSIR